MVAKKLFVTLCVSAFAFTAFAQEVNLNVQQEDPQERFEHYKKMKNVGTGLIIGGAVFGTTGVILSAAHIVKADDYVFFYAGGYNYFLTAADEDNYNKEIGKALGWYIASSIGYTAMIVGIPIRVVGRVKANEWKRKLPSAAYISPNGAKFVWNF